MNDLAKLMAMEEIEVYNLQFSKAEVEALIRILKFGNSAAAILALQESQKGTPQNAAKMNGLAADSKELMNIVISSVSIGEPENDEKH